MTRYSNRITAVPFLVLFFFYSQAGANPSWEETFFKANQAYKEGRFQEAVDGYHRLAQSGLENGHLYFNMGNAYFRLDRLGQAILNYERALLLMPRDPDLRFNLGYARDQTVDALPQSEGFLAMVFFWLDALNLAELFWIFTVANIVFWTLLSLRLFNRSEWSYYAFLATVVLWIVLGTSFGVKWHQTKKDCRAVVLTKEVSVLAGPDTGDTVLFKLHEGTVVNHERSEDGWSLIRLPDKRRGWVKASVVGRVVSGAFLTETPVPDLRVPIRLERRNP